MMNTQASSSRGIAPFLVGGLLGAAGGVLFGALLSGHLAHLIAALIHAADRRGLERDRERLRFDLLLQ